MSDRSEVFPVWQAGWQRAHALALRTLSGLQLDADLNYPNALFRAYQAQAKIWERLCSMELRTEEDVKAAAKKIGLLLDRDNDRMSASEERPIEFNKFQPVGQGTRIVTELEWIADVYECALGPTLFDEDSFQQVGLDGWQPWEIIYVTGLRAIDDAVRAFNDDQIELGTSLVFDALHEMYMCDVFAQGNERDKEYSNRVARAYGQGPDGSVPVQELNERVREAVGAAVKQDRITLAKAAAIKRHQRNKEMHSLVIDRWSAEKESYEGNKSDFARHYSRLLLQEHQFEVEATTIATRWLKGL